jgi:hypothetical protein
MPAKVFIQASQLDVEILNGMALLTKEDLLEAVKSLSITEQHWVYMRLARHLDEACDGN